MFRLQLAAIFIKNWNTLHYVSSSPCLTLSNKIANRHHIGGQKLAFCGWLIADECRI